MKKLFNKIIIIGGNRFGEDGPIFDFILACESRGIDLVLVMNRERSGYPTTNGASLLELVTKKNIVSHIVESLEPDFFSAFNDDSCAVFTINCTWIIKPWLIDLFKGRIFNYHNSELPGQRGAACHSWRLMQRNRRSAMTIHRITPDIDKGPIVHSKPIAYPDSENSLKDVYAFLSKYERSFFEEFLEGNFNVDNGVSGKSFYWPRLSTSKNGFIDWSWSAIDIHSFCQAFDDPFDGASSFVKGSRVHLKKTSIDDTDVFFHPYQAGLIYRRDSSTIWVACIGGGLRVENVNPNCPQLLKEGARLATPMDVLYEARLYAF